MIVYTLADMVREYLIEIGENTPAKYLRTMQCGINTLRELHMDVSGLPKIAYIDVDQNLHAAILPDDYIRYTKIGIVGADGNIHSLGLNSNIAPAVLTNDCGVLERPSSDLPAYSGIPLNADIAGSWRNGEFLGKLYGLGGGHNRYGYYNLDLTQGMIIFNTDFNINRVVLEYIGDFKNSEGQYELHPFLLESIKAGIYYNLIKRDRNYGLGEKQLAEKMYKTERNKALTRYNSNTKDEWLSVMRRHFMLAPKF